MTIYEVVRVSDGRVAESRATRSGADALALALMARTNDAYFVRRVEIAA